MREEQSQNSVIEKLAWSVEEVAAQLGVSKDHIYRLVSNDRIPHSKVGRLVRFSPTKINEWLLKGGTR